MNKTEDYRYVISLINSISDKDQGWSEEVKESLAVVITTLTKIKLEQQLGDVGADIVTNTNTAFGELSKFINLNICLQTELKVDEEIVTLMSLITTDVEVTPYQEIKKCPILVWLFIANHLKLRNNPHDTRLLS